MSDDTDQGQGPILSAIPVNRLTMADLAQVQDSLTPDDCQSALKFDPLSASNVDPLAAI
ncbi:hypothetical protein [Lichenibacterium dinghuense]|uniref:hypothetical protein n=1 Tax=Lichenibacterium dinghuense TaxID=2895977 RepID=UPI001F3A6E6A|nr:hypothetical protein [Lichenibacterium sp. 6Y81]